MADQMAGLAMPVPDEMLRAGGRRVGYRLSGADARPGLLYLHGTPSSRAEAGTTSRARRESGACARRRGASPAMAPPNPSVTSTRSPPPRVPLPWPLARAVG